MIKEKKKSVIKRGTIRKEIKLRKDLIDNWQYLLMILPGLICVICFCYLPMFGITIAFKSIDYAKGIWGSPWIGFENFKFLFKNPDVFIILRNTLGYNIVNIILGTFINVGIAVMFSQLANRRLGKIYQTVVMLPHFLSWIVIAYIVKAFLDYRLGSVNGVLSKLGIEAVDWYSKVEAWPFLLVFINQWKSFGYGSVVYVAAIAGIDSSLYEAAAIDGANKRQLTWYITIPELASIIIIMTILSIGNLLSANFSLYYNIPMDSGALYPVTNVISTFVFRALKINNDVGMSSAASFLQSVVGFVLVIGTNLIVRRVDSDKALF
ncbi:MAG: sugar ABC transporter permease [Ruminococcaceae bacterium]|nr:sugar ABC transporter permease [Oscillospiraceae bacterium]